MGASRLKLGKYLMGLGYGSRREVEALFLGRSVLHVDGEPLYVDDAVADAQGAARPGGSSQLTHAQVRIDGHPLDEAPGLLAALHKPVGYTCSTKDAGRLVYDLLPPRWRARSPLVSPVGRLDKDTSGLLLFTDNGTLLHRLTSPKHHRAKVYRVGLAEDLRGHEAALFAEGTLLLDGETKPLLPAEFESLGAREARLTLHEGRYHQVRRMFAATGNAVIALHRERIGGLALDALALAAGEWRVLDAAERAALGSA